MLYSTERPLPTVAQLAERKLELEAALQTAIEHQEPAFAVESLTEQFKDVARCLVEAHRRKEGGQPEKFANVTVVIMHPGEKAKPVTFKEVTRQGLKEFVRRSLQWTGFTIIPVEQLPVTKEQQHQCEWDMQHLDDIPIRNGHTYVVVRACQLPLRSQLAEMPGTVRAVQQRDQGHVKHLVAWLKRQGCEDAHDIPLDAVQMADESTLDVDGIVVAMGCAFLVKASPVVTDDLPASLHAALEKLRALQEDETTRISRLNGLKLTGILCGDRLVTSQKHLWQLHEQCDKYGFGVLLKNGTALNAGMHSIAFASRSTDVSSMPSAAPAKKKPRASSSKTAKRSTQQPAVACMLRIQPVARVQPRCTHVTAASHVRACAKTRHVPRPACLRALM